MANLELKNKINVPFADKGDKINIPDSNSDGTVNMTDGFGSKYDTPIAEGGEYIYREEMNDILNKIYAAVKELQDLAITAGFPVDMTKALNVLPLANGGTGANNASQARSNLGLGTLATKSTITSADITDGTITSNDIANNAVTNTKINDGAVTTSKIADNTITDNKISGTISVTHGGTGRNDGLSRGVKNNVIRNENNWKTENTQGFDVFYWQTANSEKLGLPTTAGVMISNVFTDDLKSFLALNLSPSFPELRIKSYNSAWKKLAFNDDVVNKMPIATTSNVVGNFRSYYGQEASPMTVTLPAGGTWMYNIISYISPGINLGGCRFGIAAGGTNIITAADNVTAARGWFWRIK